MDKHNSAQKNKSKNAKKPAARATAPVIEDTAPVVVEGGGKKPFAAPAKKK